MEFVSVPLAQMRELLKWVDELNSQRTVNNTIPEKIKTMINNAAAAAKGIKSSLAPEPKTKTSSAGIAFLKKLEGCKLISYQDSAGVWTIGYGHTDNVHFTNVITQKEADDFLISDIKIVEKALARLIKVPVSQNQYDALVCLIFNIGVGEFETSTCLKRINAKDYKGASEALTWFDKITDPETKKLVVSPGLVNRRNAEKCLFNA